MCSRTESRLLGRCGPSNWLWLGPSDGQKRSHARPKRKHLPESSTLHLMWACDVRDWSRLKYAEAATLIAVCLLWAEHCHLGDRVYLIEFNSTIRYSQMVVCNDTLPVVSIGLNVLEIGMDYEHIVEQMCGIMVRNTHEWITHVDWSGSARLFYFFFLNWICGRGKNGKEWDFSYQAKHEAIQHKHPNLALENSLARECLSVANVVNSRFILTTFVRFIQDYKNTCITNTKLGYTWIAGQFVNIDRLDSFTWKLEWLDVAITHALPLTASGLRRSQRHHLNSACVNASKNHLKFPPNSWVIAVATTGYLAISLIDMWRLWRYIQ